MKIVAAAMSVLLFSGCAHLFGPADGLIYAVGSTPNSDSCQLSVVTVGSQLPPKEWAVAGNFRQSVMVSPSRKGHRIALICSGNVVQDRVFKYGRDVPIGGELVINGSAL